MNFFKKISFNLNQIYLNSKKRISLKVASLSKKSKEIYDATFKRAGKHPIFSFLLLLGALLLIIILSNVIFKPKPTVEETTLPTKTVIVYTIGEAPKVTLQAQVEKSGVIKVVALSSGVVQSINAQVGQSVVQGQNLVSMSSNYQGGNAFSVQKQLAYAAYKNVKDTYQTNKDIIQKQKELTEKSAENADELRNINSQSIDDTQAIINSNNEMLSALEAQMQLIESDPNLTDEEKAKQIATNKQMQTQLKSANLQLQSSLNNLNYSTSDTNPPAEISNISKDIALKQLELQEKALDLNKEVSRLNLQLAQITEALMFPSTPISGTVERIYVKEGQAVSPGTPLMQISGASDSLIAVVPMSQQMANGVSKSMVSTIYIGNETYQAVPYYVSGDSTDGSLFTAQYQIPQEYNSLISDKQYLIIEIPITYANTGSTIPFIPLDSVFQTQDASYVFVVKNGKAISRKVILGQVVGSFVEVKKGLENGDQVILNRNVINGDPVKVENN